MLSKNIKISSSFNPTGFSGVKSFAHYAPRLVGSVAKKKRTFAFAQEKVVFINSSYEPF